MGQVRPGGAPCREHVDGLLGPPDLIEIGGLAPGIARCRPPGCELRAGCHTGRSRSAPRDHAIDSSTASARIRASARCWATLTAPADIPSTLTRFFGLSAEETGNVLGMSAGAVRVAQHRALARLPGACGRGVDCVITGRGPGAPGVTPGPEFTPGRATAGDTGSQAADLDEIRRSEEAINVLAARGAAGPDLTHDPALALLGALAADVDTPGTPAGRRADVLGDLRHAHAPHNHTRPARPRPARALPRRALPRRALPRRALPRRPSRAGPSRAGLGCTRPGVHRRGLAGRQISAPRPGRPWPRRPAGTAALLRAAVAGGCGSRPGQSHQPESPPACWPG